MAMQNLTSRAAGQIRATLRNRNKTQEWLSGATGIPMRTLARRLHESHPSSMSLDELAIIASALDVPVLALIADDAAFATDADRMAS